MEGLIDDLDLSNNPNFLSMKRRLSLPFQAHEEFKKADISERQKLYQAICESIWGTEIYAVGV